MLFLNVLWYFSNIGEMDDALKYFKISEKLFSDAIPSTVY